MNALASSFLYVLNLKERKGTERSMTDRGSKGLSWSSHHILAGQGGFGDVTVAVSWQDV
jgi:hypothetical protein